MSFFASCPITGGLSVPRKSGHTRNKELTIMQHGGWCPDLSGPAIVSFLGHAKKKICPCSTDCFFMYKPEAKRRGHLSTGM
jgi:hypothetical protein